MTEPLNLPLARSAIDRDYTMRSRPDLFDELWSNPSTRVLPMHNGKVLLAGSHDHPRPELKFFEVEKVPSATIRVYLGRNLEPSQQIPLGAPLVLAVLTDNAAAELQPDSEDWHVLRKTGAGLSARDAGLYAQSLALANWHENHQYCPRCGTPTLVEQGGWVRRCFKDDSEIYPRTDPAIIVSVTDPRDRILLGSQGIWEENRWSVLAGFVEPGESLAHAVIREIMEESGIPVVSPAYLGSQAWPFPYSLMVGFSAATDPEAKSLEPVPDGEEIVKLRWFTRAELQAEADSILLPGKISIARALIERWFGDELVTATELTK